MVIKGIKVENFRNIKKAQLEFCAGVNIFYGDNAQGKTNMLEAISVCLGKSFRRARASAFAPFDLHNLIDENCQSGENSESSEISETFETSENPETKLTLFYEAENLAGRENVVAYKFKNGKAFAEINNIPLKNAADLYGELKHAVFAPEHLALVRGGSELRRVFMDNIAVMQNKTHKRAVSDYTAALKQLCALNTSDDIADPNLSGVFSDILVKQGLNLTYGRLKYFEFLRSTAKALYSELTDGREDLDMVYKSNVFGEIAPDTLDFSDKQRLYNAYSDALALSLRDNFYRNSRPGAHRDDIIYTINNVNAREFGSQGQVKSVALIMKLAEAEIIREQNKENPVILLDEVLGELDKNRRDFIINRLGRSQVFITSCDYKDFSKDKENGEELRVFAVKGGEFHY